MSTPLDIITDAMEKLGVYAPGETLSDADAERGLRALGDLIDQWEDDSIQLLRLETITIDLVAGTRTYTVGPGGTIANAGRPTRIRIGPATAAITVGGVTTPLDSVSAIEWNSIYKRDLAQISDIPTVVYYEAQYPIGLFSFAPIPNAEGIATVQGYYGLASFTDNLTSPDVVLAPGEPLGLASNLALLLHSYFAVGNITQDLIAEAQQSKTTLTLTNRLSRAMNVRNIAPQVPVVPRP